MPSKSEIRDRGIVSGSKNKKRKLSVLRATRGGKCWDKPGSSTTVPDGLIRLFLLLMALLAMPIFGSETKRKYLDVEKYETIAGTTNR